MLEIIIVGITLISIAGMLICVVIGDVTIRRNPND